MGTPPVERRRRPRPQRDTYLWGFRWLVPNYQRATVRHHPLALWLAIGILVTGILQLIHPMPSSVDIALPVWLRITFDVIWILGGGFSIFGILRGKARYEAAGMMLLASGLAVDFLSILYVAPERAWVSAGFILALAFGCYRRARILTNGYEIVVSEDDSRWKQ